MDKSCGGGGAADADGGRRRGAAVVGMSAALALGEAIWEWEMGCCFCRRPFF